MENLSNEKQKEILDALTALYDKCSESKVEFIVIMDKHRLGFDGIATTIFGKNEDSICKLLAHGTMGVLDKLSIISAEREPKNKSNSKDELDGYNFSLN